MASQGVETFGDRDWGGQVLSSSVPVLVAFWAEWCLPSRTLGPALAAAADRYSGKLRVGRVDVDGNPVLKARYAIRGLPTLLLFEAGAPALRRVGLVPRDDLLALLAARV